MPAYNEEENLAIHLPGLIETLKAHVRNFEIIIVDDGSTDSTPQVIERFAKEDSRIRNIRHEKNKGPGSGLVTGVPLATMENVIFLPADIAMRLDQLSRFLEAMNFADIAIGVSTERSDYSHFRKLSSAVYIVLIRTIYGLKFRQFNYIHMYKRKTIQECLPRIGGVFVSVEILVRARDAGYSMKEVDVEYLPRECGDATCGKPSVIIQTIKDALTFWIHWRFNKIK